MYFKLSFRNARRQAQDYLVYFFTIVMVAALIYAFNGLIFSREIQELSQKLRSLPVVIVLSSAVVVGIVGWLVSYTTNFMLLKRSREFGTYILTGLEKGQVARLFLLENLVVGGCAFVFGLLLGNLIYQILRAILLSLFGMAYTFSFFFSFRVVGLTLIYFVFIYLFAQLKGRKRIRKMNIYDLIYFERRNEEVVFQKSKKRRGIFILSLILGSIGTCLIMMNDLLLGIIGAGCIIFFLYGFFLSFASGVPAYFDKRPASKYRKQNLLVFRTLTAKLATMGVLMATIALLFTATLISEGTGQIFSGIFQGRMAQTACFDLFLSSYDFRTEETGVSDYISENIPIESSRQYCIYLNQTGEMTDYIEAHTEYYRCYQSDTLMGYSDYTALRAMLGYPEVTMEPGEYLIHCQPYVEKALKGWTKPVNAGGQVLDLGGIHTEIFEQYLWDANGQGFILVVPDELAQTCPVSHHVFAAMTKEPVSEAQYSELEEILSSIKTGSGKWGSALSNGSWVLYTKAQELSIVASMTAMTVFPLYYLALVLTMTAATILTIQQLCETDRYRRQFGLLQKLGMDRREREKALRGQFAIYYAMPAIPPLIMSVPFILNLAGATEPGIMTGAYHPMAITGLSVGLFFIIYGVYILLAYTNLRRNVIT